LECHRIIRTARDSGCNAFVMEVASQAYKMDRSYGIEFDYGIFVNITNDHISPNEHADFEDYFSCKLEIVKKYQHAVINLDDPHADRVLNAAKHAKQIYTILYRIPVRIFMQRIFEKTGFRATLIW
jgi:UDP-N-acetylmuramyl tripeptide synthase